MIIEQGMVEVREIDEGDPSPESLSRRNRAKLYPNTIDQGEAWVLARFYRVGSRVVKQIVGLPERISGILEDMTRLNGATELTPVDNIEADEDKSSKK